MTPADRQAIDDNIRLTVERTALRKVRRLVDAGRAEEAEERSLARRALAIAAVVGVLLTGTVIYGALHSGDRFDFGRAVEVPARVSVPQKS